MKSESEITKTFLILDELRKIHKHLKSGILSLKTKKTEIIPKIEGVFGGLEPAHKQSIQGLVVKS